jgi:predicted nucleotidyltransferase
MRLTAEQAKIIRSAVREIYGDDSQLWLFGSRVDDERRGGDIDLLVRPDSVSGGYTLMDKNSSSWKTGKRFGRKEDRCGY